jgi:hypothetical protein
LLPLRRDRHKRLEELQTGDGRPLPPHLRAQVNRQLDRLELLLLKQIKAVEAERDALLVAAHTPAAMPASMLLNIRGIGSRYRCAQLGLAGLSGFTGAIRPRQPSASPLPSAISAMTASSAIAASWRWVWLCYAPITPGHRSNRLRSGTKPATGPVGTAVDIDRW